MDFLSFLKKECWDGSMIWFWESCPDEEMTTTTTTNTVPEETTTTTTTQPINEEDDAIKDAQVLTFSKIGSETLIQNGTFVRPSACMTASGLLRIGVEGPNMQSVYLIRQKTNGSFESFIAAQSSKVPGSQNINASRVYVPSCTTSPVATSIAWRSGIKEWGTQYGPGLCVTKEGQAVGSAQFKGKDLGKYAVRCDMKDDNNVVMFVRYGNWKTYDVRNSQNSPVTGSGNLNVGDGGEKIAFMIDAGDTWHAATGGSSKTGSTYINTNLSQKLVWADFKTYPAMGDDIAGYPGLCAWNGNKAIVSHAFNGKIYINIIKKGIIKYSIKNLPILSGATMQDRFPTQYCKFGSRMIATWVENSIIYIADVEQKIIGKANKFVIAQGSYPTITTFNNELYIVYVRNGLKLQKVAVA
jgi:hypothetical protein